MKTEDKVTVTHYSAFEGQGTQETVRLQRGWPLEFGSAMTSHLLAVAAVSRSREASRAGRGRVKKKVR